MSFRVGRPGAARAVPHTQEVHEAPVAVRAALTFPARYLLWVLASPQPQGREARITYYLHRSVDTRRRAA